MRNLMGTEPAPALVERIRARYEEIGGSSPLLGIARDLADGVTTALAEADVPMPVQVGMRYWQPFIADAIEALVSEGVDRVVMVSLSPFEAAVTHGEYRGAVQAALSGHPSVSVIDAPLLSELPEFLDLQTRFAAEAIDAVGLTAAPLVFSAHSLPAADIAADDSYARGIERAAAEVASRFGLGAGSQGEVLAGIEAFGSSAGPRRWLVAYQSQGARGGEWLGPSLDEVIGAVEREQLGGLVVVPLGFATDHMETRYDLDVVAQRVARQAGISFGRSALPNANPALASGIAHAVIETLASLDS